ncbi:MAG: SH3 domain-containing protein [Verrucomicrobiales bacterium]|nr:SH3 domain-containing protein [Verrucomicrobiales bacterium]
MKIKLLPAFIVWIAAVQAIFAADLSQLATIDDSDGFTWVRRGGSASAEKVDQIRDSEEFFTEEQESDWWKVKTNRGIEGFMHRSRIKLQEPKTVLQVFQDALGQDMFRPVPQTVWDASQGGYPQVAVYDEKGGWKDVATLEVGARVKRYLQQPGDYHTLVFDRLSAGGEGRFQISGETSVAFRGVLPEHLILEGSDAILTFVADGRVARMNIFLHPVRIVRVSESELDFERLERPPVRVPIVATKQGVIGLSEDVYSSLFPGLIGEAFNGDTEYGYTVTLTSGERWIIEGGEAGDRVFPATPTASSAGSESFEDNERALPKKKE